MAARPPRNNPRFRRGRRLQDYPSLVTDPDAALGNFPISERQQRAWLQRSANWPDLQVQGQDRKRWSARKVLGAGTSGIVGHWKYLGTTRNVPGQGPVDIEPSLGDVLDVAIKQVGPGDTRRRDLMWESELLQLLNTTNSDHIVRIYKGFQTQEGTNTNTIRDPAPFKPDNRYDDTREVSRIFLEHCEGGDMWSLIQGSSPNYDPPEEQIWRILSCLFKGLLAMERGTEDSASPRVPRRFARPIVHFDIKPGNILIGQRDLGDHARLETFKLADFSGALPMPPLRVDWSGQRWIRHSDYRGTTKYNAPESHWQGLPYEITWKSDTWQAAASVWELCLHGHNMLDAAGNLAQAAIRQDLLFPTPTTNSVCSADVLFNPAIFRYSARLATLLCQCLSYDPAARPTCLQVVRQAERTIAEYDRQRVNPQIDRGSLRNESEPNQPIGPLYAGPIPISIPIQRKRRVVVPAAPPGGYYPPIAPPLLPLPGMPPPAKPIFRNTVRGRWPNLLQYLFQNPTVP